MVGVQEVELMDDLIGVQVVKLMDGWCAGGGADGWMVCSW